MIHQFGSISTQRSGRRVGVPLTLALAELSRQMGFSQQKHLAMNTSLNRPQRAPNEGEFPRE